jgi:NAD(P)H-flavin reductase
MRLLFSARGPDDVIYRKELEQLEGGGLSVAYTLTRSQPAGWTGYSRRVDRGAIAELEFASRAAEPANRL